jgi:type 1 glutamine amidotransferase
VKDELYIHEIKPGVSICYSTEKEGRTVPVVWTQNYGKGRVCYIEPGHVAASLEVPEVARVIKEGLLWVCGG